MIPVGAAGRALAQRLPDLPRWIEARGALRSGEAAVLGLQEHPEWSLVVRDPATALVIVIGEPVAAAVRRAARECAAGDPESATVIAPYDQLQRLTELLPDWHASRAVLHRLDDRSRLVAVPQGSVRLIDFETLRDHHLPDGLRDELRTGAARSPLAVAFVDDRAVAFCYASRITESLWDVSIDTLAGFRRRGFAARAASFLIEHLWTQGKTPVWGAEESNLASLALARKLGFVPVDELVLLVPRR